VREREREKKFHCNKLGSRVDEKLNFFSSPLHSPDDLHVCRARRAHRRVNNAEVIAQRHRTATSLQCMRVNNVMTLKNLNFRENHAREMLSCAEPARREQRARDFTCEMPETRLHSRCGLMYRTEPRKDFCSSLCSALLCSVPRLWVARKYSDDL
jgi:hypothetical protein